MAEDASEKPQNFVRGETNTLELANLGQAINLRVYREGGMKGRMLVGHGAVGWIPRGWVKTRRKTIPWDVFAVMMKEWPFGSRAEARLKFVDGGLRWRSPGKKGAGREVSWAEFTARMDTPMTKELEEKVKEARKLILEEQKKARKSERARRKKTQAARLRALAKKKERQAARLQKDVERKKREAARLQARADKQLEEEAKAREKARAEKKKKEEERRALRRELARRKREAARARQIAQLKAAREKAAQARAAKKKLEQEAKALREARAAKRKEEEERRRELRSVLIAGLREAMGDMAYVSCPVENDDVLRLKRSPKAGPTAKIHVSLNDKPVGWVDARSLYWPASSDQRLIDRVVADLESFVANPDAWIEHAWKGENRCVVCGRKLTNPLSVALGIGPVCRKKYASVAVLKRRLARRAAAKRKRPAAPPPTGAGRRPPPRRPSARA